MLIPYKSRLRYLWNTRLFPAQTQRCVSVGCRWTRQQQVFAWVALVIASLTALLPNLSFPLIEPDETRYAQIALEMNESRDWITPTIDGKPYLDKPPLMYWLTATSLGVFGGHEAAARLPSVLAALFTILLTFALGSKIVGRRAAWLGSMSLVLCGGFVLAGRFLILDALLALFTTVCMLSGYIAVRGQHHRWAWWMLAGVACALGTLTKGPIALVLCAPPLVASGWLRADQTRTRALHWVAFVAPMFLICVPWYIAVAKFNPQFVDYFFWEHNFKRFTEGSNHAQPFWFYAPVIFAAMFPASLLLPSAGYFLASRSNRKRLLRSKDLGFLLCGVVWMLLFFSLASCKLPTYILPVIPLVCLMIGVMLDQTVFRADMPNRITNYLRPFPQRATMILLISGLAIAATDVWIGGQVSVGVLIATVLCVVVAGATILIWNRELAFGLPAWAATAVVGIAVTTFASARLLPTISSTRSVYIKAARLAEAQPDSPIVFFGETPNAAQFHLPSSRLTYFPKEQKDEFAAFLSRQNDVIVVTDDSRIEAIRAAVTSSHDLLVTPDHDHLYLGLRVNRSAVDVMVQNGEQLVR